MENTITYTVDKIKQQLQKEYKMDVVVHPNDSYVFFNGTELECYKMAYKFKNKNNIVSYSEPLKTWYIAFFDWFSEDFASKIVE